MPHDIVTVPCLADNYAFLAHDATSGETALIDAPEAAPILRALDQRGWRLSHVLLSHHHHDHVDGLGEILAAQPAQVIGAAADAHRLPRLDRAVTAADSLRIGGEAVHVLDASGHTIGHVAYHFPQSRAVFTGDSLMALGCGRLFEGTAAQMWATLTRLRALPDDTRVFSGHEYTQSNGRFALSVDPGNPDLRARVAAVAEARAAGRATVPSLVGEERRTNPFLRADAPEVQASVGMAGADPAAVLAEIRRRKDRF